MTYAKEPKFIESLLHSEECGRSLLYDVYGNEVCSIPDILNHIDTLTRERDDAAQDATRQLDLRYAANRELVALQRETDALKAKLAKGPMPDDERMKSGDQVFTGTGDARRPLTLDEAEAGGLPEPMTADEWAAMHRASADTEAERGAAVERAEQVVLTAAGAHVKWLEMYDRTLSGEHPGPYHRQLQQTQRALRAAVAALKAAEGAP